MKVLLVKTSSLGDLIHTFPAITDASKSVPDIQIDWVVEPAYEELCLWHPAVEKVITVSYRHWRRHCIKGIFGGPLFKFLKRLRATKYHAIIDAQGLYKSAVITGMTSGYRNGYDLWSSREKFASLAYNNAIRIPRTLHAIERNRLLFAAALGYSVPEGPPDYGLDWSNVPASSIETPFVLFLHGSARPTNQWPVQRWRSLAKIVGEAGYTVCVPWLSETDRRRAEEIARDQPHVVTPKANLIEMGSLVAGAVGIVGVETGFAHLAAALGRPTVTLYGQSGPKLHGTCGEAQEHLSSVLPCSPCHNRICNYTTNARQSTPCMSEFSAERVWLTLLGTMTEYETTANLGEPTRFDKYRVGNF